MRWTGRQAIAEEHQWRAEVAHEAGWYGPEVHATQDWEDRESRDTRARFRVGGRTVPQPAPLEPDQIAAIYRSLRKGREDSKDEPGAADFYYGEMEMRRRKPRRQEAQQTLGDARLAEPAGDARRDGEAPRAPGPRVSPGGERVILWLYWLVSGYGLRASRALISLALTVVLFAFLFDWWGFRPDRGFGRTLLFSIESTSSLFRAPETEGSALTAGGEVLQVALRLLGPLFFGLTLLSLRGRVKR